MEDYWREACGAGTQLGNDVRLAGNSKSSDGALRSDTHVKSAYQLQPLKTLPKRPNSLPDCDLQREGLPVRGS